MAQALFATCVLSLLIFYSIANAHEDENPDLKIFGIEQFCASHSSHHVLKTSKLICLLCKGFDMSCLLKTTTTSAPTTSTDAPTTTPTTTPTPTTTTTPKSTDTTTKSPESSTTK